ncbi:hypothetical protein [Methanomethylovorans sp.]|uniref:COG1470 family protein n=1 Tax=Methanomethylovorans sp. TaxID=2758717 RepID=UPI00351C69AC
MRRQQLIVYGMLAAILIFLMGATAMAYGELISPFDGTLIGTAENVAGSESVTLDPYYTNLQLKTGDSESFEVIASNNGNTTETLSVSVYNPGYSEYPIDESWISIDPSSAVIEAGKEATFNVTIAIPQGIEVGSYDCMLVFNSEQNSSNSMALIVDVWDIPDIQISTSYIYDWVEAGKKYDYKMILKNTGTSEISINPKMAESMDFYGGYTSEQAFDKDSIEITSPSSIQPGESATVNVKLSVPEDAKGDFYGNIDLNIDDPSIYEDSDQIYVNFHVPVQPEKPYEIPFKVNINGTATIELKTTRYEYYSISDFADPSFEVKIIDPSGNEAKNTLINNVCGGSVAIGGDPYAYTNPEDDSEYREDSKQYADTYTVQVSPGNWTLSVMPYGAESFEYNINIKPTE